MNFLPHLRHVSRMMLVGSPRRVCRLFVSMRMAVPDTGLLRQCRSPASTAQHGAVRSGRAIYSTAYPGRYLTPESLR